jgi:hypothetical protein
LRSNQFAVVGKFLNVQVSNQFLERRSRHWGTLKIELGSDQAKSEFLIAPATYRRRCDLVKQIGNCEAAITD